MSEPLPSPRRRGRPRSEAAHRALLDAALREFIAKGYQAMSLEEIAIQAGVSKVTLYRRWDSKMALVTEVLQSLSDQTPMLDYGSLEADIRILLSEAFRASTASPVGQILPRLLGEISGNRELLAIYRTVILGPRLERLHTLITRARQRGEIRDDLATSVIADLIAGPLFYHLVVVAQVDQTLSNDLPEQLTHAILDGIARKQS